MSQLAPDLFVLMDSAIIYIHFRNSQAPVSLTITTAASLTREGHVGHYTNEFNDLNFFQIPFKDHSMQILLPRRHLLLLLILLLLVVVVVVVVVVIVQIVLIVAVKSGPEVVNKTLWPGPVNINFGPGLVNTNLGSGPVNTNWEPESEIQIGARAGKYKLGGRGRGPGPDLHGQCFI